MSGEAANKAEGDSAISDDRGGRRHADRSSTCDKPSTVGLHQQRGALEEAKADAPERRKEVIPKLRRVPAAMQAEGDGVLSMGSFDEWLWKWNGARQRAEPMNQTC